MVHASQSMVVLWRGTTARLEGLGAWLAPLGLRLILAWEFGEPGFEKLRGSNWFSQVQENFPFPFNVISADISFKLPLLFALMLWPLMLNGAGRLSLDHLFGRMLLPEAPSARTVAG